MSSKKAIQINPEYFSLKKNRTLKKEPREKKPKNKTGKQQKKELLRRLKEIQDSKHNKKTTEIKTNASRDTVESSIQFLNTLSNEQKEKEKEPVKQKDNIPTIQPHNAPDNIPTIQPHNAPDNIPMIQLSNEPPYSNLKGSKKPSYREWLKNKSNNEKINIEDKETLPTPIKTERQEKLKKIQKKYKKNNKHSKTIKITETFGKRNGKVSIHIKNNENKQILENEKKTLKKHSIPKIKAYLKEHNLLKIGSYAPNDVIRELYENAILSGDITNNNKDILVHNFLEN